MIEMTIVSLALSGLGFAALWYSEYRVAMVVFMMAFALTVVPLIRMVSG